MNKSSTTFDRILCPLDGSREGESALPFVENLAAKIKAEVILLHVVSPQYEISLADAYSPKVIELSEEYLKKTSSVGREYLNTVKKRLEKLKIVTTCEVKVGSPAQTIVDYAGEMKVDLIALSTHGRSGIGRWLMGSVADKVLHATNIPILMIRASGSSEE